VARTSAVEYERVAEACSSLFLEGKSPSFESVYDLIGRKGGAKVVQGMIADWRKEMANRFMAGRTNPDLPEELITESDKVLTVVWRLALEKSDTAYADERSRLDQARVDMAAAVTQAQERAAEFEREALSLQGERQALQARLQGSQAEIEDLRQRLSDTTTLLRARDEQIGQMREDGARLANTLESERRNHEAELLAERDRHEQAVNAERQRAHESVEREREIAAGERQYLMRQTDEIRQAAKANEAVPQGTTPGGQILRRELPGASRPGGKRSGVLARQGRSGGGRVQPLAAGVRGSGRENRWLAGAHTDPGARTRPASTRGVSYGKGGELSGDYSGLSSSQARA
jgi:Skp family chaperone for outer membrane proteins